MASPRPYRCSKCGDPCREEEIEQYIPLADHPTDPTWALICVRCCRAQDKEDGIRRYWDTGSEDYDSQKAADLKKWAEQIKKDGTGHGQC